MDNAIPIRELIQREPWRAGQVWEIGALDPTWLGIDLPTCDGEIEWEKETNWWKCAKCGYCGFWTNTKHHPVQHPYQTFSRYVVLFLIARKAQGYTRAQAFQQMAHAFAAVAKLMISMPAEELVRFVERLRDELTE